MNEKVKRFLEDADKAKILCDLGLCERRAGILAVR